jgi:hypothetical protein
MGGSSTVRLPQMVWYGDTQLEIDLPDSWDVTVCHMHGHDAPPLSEDGIRKAFRNPIGTKTIREMAEGKREVTALFVGDFAAEHEEGVKAARDHYATDPVSDCDIVVANCYFKANEMVLGPLITSPLLSKEGGDMVLVVVTPEGQINHYWIRSFGKAFGGRGWFRPRGLPLNTRRLTVMAPYPDKVGGDLLAPYDLINWARAWAPVIEELKSRYGDKAKVAVIPDATVQYFPDPA